MLYAWCITIQLWPPQLEIYDDITLWYYHRLDLLQYLFIIHRSLISNEVFHINNKIIPSTTSRLINSNAHSKDLQNKRHVHFQGTHILTQYYGSMKDVWLSTFKYNKNYKLYKKIRKNALRSYKVNIKINLMHDKYVKDSWKVVIRHQKQWPTYIICVLDFMKIKYFVVWKTVLREQQGRSQTGIIYFPILLVTKSRIKKI